MESVLMICFWIGMNLSSLQTTWVCLDEPAMVEAIPDADADIHFAVSMSSLKHVKS